MSEEPQQLERLIELLGDPHSHEPRPDHVDLVQTHASVVAITDTQVLKVKKAVDLGFLDFSTRSRRLHYCEEEVRLNRRMCEHVYQGVIPILRDSGSKSGLRFGTADEFGSPGVVDYAVQMGRLADGRFMNQLVTTAGITERDLGRVVDALTGFQRHPATEATSAWGTVGRIRVSIDENFEQIERHVGTLLSPAAFVLLRDEAERFMDHERELFNRRVEKGMVRDCHGDLHLDHIHITEERVCIYDCIEFNERFRSIDVANDVAFLAMDLDYHGRPDLAASFVRRMAEALRDPEMLDLIGFYKTYRAIVRGKVAGMKSLEPEVPAMERRSASEDAQAHFRLATRYTATGGRPLAVVVMGRTGTGKSTQARMLGEALGWRVLSSDVLRKRLAGLPLYDRGDDTARAALYSSESSERTYRALIDGAVAELERGRGVVLDATFSRRSDRNDLTRALNPDPPSAGPVHCRFVEVVAPEAVVRGRLRERETQAHEVSDARIDDLESINSAYEPVSIHERARVLTVSTVGAPKTRKPKSYDGSRRAVGSRPTSTAVEVPAS